jgi:hypothetical protein
LLLRAEAVASSRIEGLEVGARRLLEAQVARALGEDASDVTATEVLAGAGSTLRTSSASPGRTSVPSPPPGVGSLVAARRNR